MGSVEDVLNTIIEHLRVFYKWPSVFAVKNCYVEVLSKGRVWYKYDDLVESFDLIGLTPLHFAVMSGVCEAVELLLSRGADPNIRDEFGNTPLHNVVPHLLPDEATCIAESLLAYGADPNMQDKYGDTPLHKVLSVKIGEDVAFMIDYANVNIKNSRGQTPLHLAVETGLPSAVEKLLLRGADVNARDNEGNTPLHYAARACRIEEAELLLLHGAEVDARNNEGLTPAMVALRSCRPNEINTCVSCLQLADLLDSAHP